MRIRESTCFPYPILASHTDDYRAGGFRLILDSAEQDASGEQVTLKGHIDVDADSLLALLANGGAQAGLMVTCGDTYLDRWYPCDPGAFTLEVAGGRLRGAVYVQALIVSIAKVVLDTESIVEGYNEFSRQVQAGRPLAISEEIKLEAGFDQLVSMESIFSLLTNENTTDGSFEVDLDSETIDIHVNTRLSEYIQSLRGTDQRVILLSALYLPVIMHVLDNMRASEFETRRWYSVIRSKCNAAGISINKNIDLPISAQKLLDGPLGLMASMHEG